ncbi:hypothetical protein [Burkholderia plantarii]|uniref:hypothetical protein n=1 Tax=Burkholderia plantarii TaxID=41899 RepID=UPI0018DB8A38|nr:hypothetical protein [Burkholderia plantarii]MBI0330430.1 hypothetical protein [Burkholderia plantarii]
MPVALAAMFLAALGGCGGGSDSTSGGTGNTGGTSGTAVSAPTAMTGTVAVGDALAGANVQVIDSTGKLATATSAADGSYTVPIVGLAAPFLIVATDPNGTNAPMYSVVAAVSASSSAPVIANVTPLTTAVTAQLTPDGNPLDLITPATLTSLATPANVTASVAKLDTALNSILTQTGGFTAAGANAFDPIGSAFTPDQSGADAVIDSVAVTPSPTGGLQLASIASPNTPIALNSSTPAATAPLAVPAVPANYLATLLSQLGQCLGGTASACSSAIDAAYLENGFTSFQTFHSGISASGVTLSGAKTLAFFPPGTFANVNVQSALVQIFYVGASGSRNFATTIVQQLPNGNWDIIGNQQAYNVSITSFLAQRQFLDPGDAPFGRYEAGLGITIPVTGAPNPATLASASVTGPGINGTAWLEPRNGVGNVTLSLSQRQLTGAPTGGVSTNTNTNLYRWSWQALPGNTGVFKPGSNNSGYYTPASIDTTTVPQYAVYTVSFFDANGNAIGQPVSVMNPTPVLAASAGAGINWQTLSPALQDAFLNPGGSLAGAQASVGVSWSNLVGSANANLAPLVTGVQIQGVPGTGVSPATEVDGWWTGPGGLQASGQYTESVTAGVGQNGVQQCTTACPFPALQAGGSRVVQLNWTGAQVGYYNIWKYND